MSKIRSTTNEEHVARVLCERRMAGMDKGFTIGRNPWRTPKLSKLVAGRAEGGDGSLPDAGMPQGS